MSASGPISSRVIRRYLRAAAGAGTAGVVSVAAAPFVGVGSAGLAASAGFSVFLEVLLFRKPLSLALRSESALGAVEAR